MTVSVRSRWELPHVGMHLDSSRLHGPGPCMWPPACSFLVLLCCSASSPPQTKTFGSTKPFSSHHLLFLVLGDPGRRTGSHANEKVVSKLKCSLKSNIWLTDKLDHHQDVSNKFLCSSFFHFIMLPVLG